MKGVLITGTTSGIGEQLTKDYVDQGWQVIACGRNTERLEQLHHYSANIYPLSFDVTDYQQTMKALSSLPWTPELWILNAGNCEYLDDGIVDAQLVARIMAVNVTGMCNCIEGCQPYFAVGHHLVLIGSIASEVALPRAEAYGASKAAVSYLARSLAIDLTAKNIQVSCVYPGFIATPLTDKNNFSMPMILSVEQASQQLRTQIEKKRSQIYFPARFTTWLRLFAWLPYHWQIKLVAKFMK